MTSYIARIIDDELDELISHLPAISVEGPRAVGKTETALRRANTVHRLDDARQQEILRAEPELLVKGDPPVLIDEWQRMPFSWDLVRRAVDRDRSTSRFLLTGSAAPSEAPTHSGAGRIVTIRMRPLSLAERALAPTRVSLAGLLSGRRPPLEGDSDVGLESYASEIVGSGFPGIRSSPPRSIKVQLDGYIDRIVEHDFNESGRSVRDRRSLRRWLTAYAAATSTTASYTKIRDAATPGEADKPSKSTTIHYRRLLEQLWMIEEVPAWFPSSNRLARLSASSTHQLADPALAARLLGVGLDTLLTGSDSGHSMPRDGTLLGALFESLVTLSVRVYAQANGARVAHLRTRAGEREIDLIVEREDGRVVALEVKLSALVADEDVRHLRWLADRIGPNLLDAAVVTTGKYAYRRPDGIGVIPAALLGA